MSQELGYGAAMAELEAILHELEGDQLDVDVLAAKVRRASELIQICRGRIARAQSDVDAIVTDLEGFEAPGDVEPSGDGSGDGSEDRADEP